MGKYSEYFLMHENMLICTTCSWAIPKPKDCTTSSLRHHLRKKHPELYSCFKEREERTKYERATAAERALAIAQGMKRIWKSEPEAGPEPTPPKQPNWSAVPSSSSVPETSTNWEPERCRMDIVERAITQMLCTSALPSTFLDSPGFRNFITVVAPRFQMKPRVHFAERSLSILYEEYVSKVKTMLNSAAFVSFSSDLRLLSDGRESLMTFTVHFIDEMVVPRFATVTANLIHGIPTLDETRALVTKALDCFDLGQEKLHILVEHWPSQNASSSPFLKTVSDFSQKLQKAINEGLRLLLKDDDTLMHNVKKTAGTMWKSDHEKLLRDCNRLCLQTSERGTLCWNCLYLVLCRFLEQKNSLVFALAEATPGCPRFDVTAWEQFREIVGVLKPIDFAIGLVRHRYFTPISVVIPLYKVIIRQLKEDSTCSETVRDAICGTLENLMQGCEDQEEFFLSTIVDPRFRAAYFSSDKRQQFLERLEEAAFLPVSAPARAPEPVQEDSSNPFIAFRKLEPVQVSQAHMSKVEAGTRALAELEDYLSHDPSFATDPYEFWQNEVNAAKYPLIKKLALKYLSAPGISVECQSVFSLLELISGDLRKHWEPDELEKLLFLHHNVLIFGF